MKVVGVQAYDPYKGEKEGKLREVGGQAVWSLSSCKPGFGIEQLRDGCTDTYWQSDGAQPHFISIQFRRKTTVHDICIYTDYKADESYTPNKLSIRAGSHSSDLFEVEQVELNEPSGWICILLRSSDEQKPLRAFVLQIVVLSNHQNGRDTHLRQIKIHSPAQVKRDVDQHCLSPEFSTTTLRQFNTIR